MTVCIDLKERFSDRYRIVHEESYWVERGDNSRVHDPWLLVIPCKHGDIYPHGGEWLAASTNYRGPVAKRLTALPGVRVLQDGHDGINVVFHVDDIESVAEVLKPRRRRTLTVEQRNDCAARLRKYQFGAAGHDSGAERRCDPAPTVVSQAV